MIHVGDKIVAPRGYSKVHVGAKLVFDAAAAGALTVTAEPTLARGAVAFGSPTDCTTQYSQVTATGGTEPYSYIWAEVSSDGSWSIKAPLASSAAFTAVLLAPNTVRNGAFKCTVTDARGRTGEVTISAFAQNYGDLDGNPA